MSTFKIVITETKTVMRKGREWTAVGDGGEYKDYERQQEEDTEIYCQVVDSLNLEKVILAVNGIQGWLNTDSFEVER